MPLFPILPEERCRRGAYILCSQHCVCYCGINRAPGRKGIGDTILALLGISLCLHQVAPGLAEVLGLAVFCALTCRGNNELKVC